MARTLDRGAPLRNRRLAARRRGSDRVREAVPVIAPGWLGRMGDIGVSGA
jgi:hypothetical protein